MRNCPDAPVWDIAHVVLGRRTPPLLQRTTLGNSAGTKAADWIRGGAHCPWAPRRLAARGDGKESGELPTSWGRGAQDLSMTVPGPLVGATHSNDPRHVRGIDPVTKSQPSATMNGALPSGAEVSPQKTGYAVPSLSPPPAPPAPLSPAPHGRQQVAKAKSISLSPAPSPELAPSEPFTESLSESAPPPPHEGSVQPSAQRGPMSPVRFRRSERHPARLT